MTDLTLTENANPGTPAGAPAAAAPRRLIPFAPAALLRRERARYKVLTRGHTYHLDGSGLRLTSPGGTYYQPWTAGSAAGTGSAPLVEGGAL